LVVPRKRWKYKIKSYDVPRIDPGDRHATTDEELVGAALVDLEEVAVLPDIVREQLSRDLVDAVRYARAGVAVGKIGVSNEATAQQVYMSDVARAMERAGLWATRWRKRYDDGDGPSDDAPESLFFRLAREVADVSGIALPQDLKLPGNRAAHHQYGVMSPAMESAQRSELAARRQRLSNLERRLRAGAPSGPTEGRIFPQPSPKTGGDFPPPCA
jgi:hypothetical protein